MDPLPDPERTVMALEETVDILISYSGNGGGRYAELARRVREALADAGRGAELLPRGSLFQTPRERLDGAVVLVVGPAECASTAGEEEEFLSGLEVARARVMVLSEDAEDERCEDHFGLPVEFDAVLDVGFASQEGKPTFEGVPYRFVPDGPTRREERSIRALSPAERSVPWAVVGYRMPEHMGMIVGLVEDLDPKGLVISPEEPGVSGEPAGPLAVGGLGEILARTNYFVWGAWGTSGYYESWRCLSALSHGTVPCKVDGSARTPEVPGVFRSVESLSDDLGDGDFRGRYEAARSFYLSRDPLGERIEEALRGV